ncbi:MAG: c-type cytochrome domain-containing protein [Pseudomonadota bacterium]
MFIAAVLALLVCVPASGKSAADAAPQWHMLDEYCSACHNDDDFYGGLTLSSIAAGDTAAGENTEEWEKILRMVDGGEMPPRKKPQPTPQARAAFTQWLRGSIDARAATHPNPGRATLRRLNRAEYANAGA